MTAPTFFTLTGTWLPDTSKGSISGTASIQMLVGEGDVLPTTLGGVIVPHLIPARVVNGVLCDQTGRPGVSLLANTAELNLSTALYYTVVFSLTYHPASGLPQSLKINPVTFTAATTATTVDLGSVTPAAGVEAAQIASVGSANIIDATTIGRRILTAADAAAVLADIGAAGIPSAGVVKSTGTALTPAVAGTDYAPPTTGSSLLKANGAGGFAAASSTSDYVPWQGGTGGVLPATSGQKLTTQGGNTLDDGSGNVVIKGGTLDGITVGGTTPAVAVTTGALQSKSPLTFNGAGGTPWLNQSCNATGTLNAGIGASVNSLALNDYIVGSSNYITGLTVYQNVLSPAVGPRLAIQGSVNISSVGTSTITQCQYVGILGRAQTGVNLGGTPTSAIGEFWGGWFQGATSGGSHHYSVFGVEVDLSVQSDVQLKVGLRVQTTSTDTTQGTTDDAAMQVFHGSGTVRWLNGLMFGSNQANAYGGSNPAGISQAWPFDSTSTMIGTSVVGSGLPANIGIDFSQVTFTDCAIKTGPAPIQMGAMASPPATPASGKGKLYVASDGSLHFIGASGTDTRLAVA